MVIMIITQTVLTWLEFIGLFWLIQELTREKINGWRKWFLAMATVALAGITSYQRYYFLYSRWYLLFCIFLCIIVSCVCFRRKRKYLLILNCIYFETVYNLQLIIYMIGIAAFPDKDWENEVQCKMGIEHVIIYFAVDIIIFFLLYEIRNHRMQISAVLDKKTLVWLIIPVLEHATLFLCDAVMSTEHIKEGLGNATRIFLLSFFGTLIILIFLILHKYQINVNKQKETIALYVSRYEALVESNEERAKLYHDMSHHMIAIRSLIQNDNKQEALNYLNELYPVLQAEEKLKSSPILFLIAEKQEEAQSKGIQVTADYEGDWTDLVNEELQDWCALLGNLWDNAIEGCESAKECKEPAIINFIMQRTGNAVKIRIKNTAEQMKKGNEIPKTTKTETRYHGLGFQIILGIVDKYHGDMEWNCEDGIFEIKIVALL